MNTILIGNLVALTGALVMVGIGVLKNRNRILAAQCLQFVIMGVGNLILGGVTGFISNIVSAVRNIVCIKFPFTLPLKLLFIAVQVALSLGVNTQGRLGLLPVVAACVFTWFLDTKDEITLKAVIIATQLMWLVYDFALHNYVAFCFDILTVISTLYGVYRIRKSAGEDPFHQEED